MLIIVPKKNPKNRRNIMTDDRWMSSANHVFRESGRRDRHNQKIQNCYLFIMRDSMTQSLTRDVGLLEQYCFAPCWEHRGSSVVSGLSLPGACTKLVIFRLSGFQVPTPNSGGRKARPYEMLLYLLGRGGDFGEQFDPELTAEGLPSVCLRLRHRRDSGRM